MNATDKERELAKLVDYIHAHYTEEGAILRLKSLVRRSPWTESHLQRLLAGHLGMPVGEYLSQLRVERAKRLLRATTMTPKEITYAVGYSPRSLERVFQRLVGMTMVEYRRKLNEADETTDAAAQGAERVHMAVLTMQPDAAEGNVL